MATTTLLAPSSTRSRLKIVLWIFLGLTALFVFITSEVLLVTDYPMYHASVCRSSQTAISSSRIHSPESLLS